MEKYTAVRTTGIYCRAGCAGRPKIQNVELFSHPAAAESAGYRACLRCRPDQLPDPEIDPAIPIVVHRAMALVNEGFLDNSSEAALGDAVGIHPRHLRRLFVEHIGATASKVAASRRAHFARRLLDETDLSVEDVAYASGFTSVRQCRRVLREVFKFSPTELRKRRRADAVMELDGGVRLRLPTPPDYPMEQVFSFIGDRATPGVEIVEAMTYRRTIVSCGHVGVVEVEADTANRELIVTAHLPTLRELLSIASRTKRLFGLRPGNRRALETLVRDPILGSHISSSTVHIPGCWDPFETAIRIIVGQQVSVRGATTVTGQLAALCGTDTPGLETFGLDRCFPTIEQVANADLSSLEMPRRRRQTIAAYATLTLEGKLPKRSEVTNIEDIVDRLMRVPGVGPWTANLIALRVFDFDDAFPAGDLGLRKGAAVLLGEPTPMKEPDLVKYAERWRPYRSTASMVLWNAASHYGEEADLECVGAHDG